MKNVEFPTTFWTVSEPLVQKCLIYYKITGSFYVQNYQWKSQKQLCSTYFSSNERYIASQLFSLFQTSSSVLEQWRISTPFLDEFSVGFFQV